MKSSRNKCPTILDGDEMKATLQAMEQRNAQKKREKNKNNEGIWRQDMMKNTHGLNRCWVVFDDILRFADYIPVVLSHTIHRFFFAIIFTRRDKNPSWLNTHIRNIHAWLSLLASWRYIYTHFISPVLIVFQISLHLSFSPLALDDKNISIFLAAFDVFRHLI